MRCSILKLAIGRELGINLEHWTCCIFIHDNISTIAAIWLCVGRFYSSMIEILSQHLLFMLRTLNTSTSTSSINKSSFRGWWILYGESTPYFLLFVPPRPGLRLLGLNPVRPLPLPARFAPPPLPPPQPQPQQQQYQRFRWYLV